MIGVLVEIYNKRSKRQVETKYTTRDGDIRINIKTVVFQKGVDGIRKVITGEC